MRLDPRFFASLTILILPRFADAADLKPPNGSGRSIHCMAIREEPGAPTFGFELFRAEDDGYTARFLTFSEKENQTPQEELRIDELECEFDKSIPKIFLCTKLGASVSGVRLIETEIPAPGFKKRSRTIYQMRAIGIEVPNSVRIFEFRLASECQAR